MNFARLAIFQSALSDAMTKIRADDPTFYSWRLGATPELIAAQLAKSVFERGSIRGINLTDRSRRFITRALGIKNTLASFDAYLNENTPS